MDRGPARAAEFEAVVGTSDRAWPERSRSLDEAGGGYCGWTSSEVPASTVVDLARRSARTHPAGATWPYGAIPWIVLRSAPTFPPLQDVATLPRGITISSCWAIENSARRKAPALQRDPHLLRPR